VLVEYSLLDATQYGHIDCIASCAIMSALYIIVLDTVTVSWWFYCVTWL